MEKKRTPLAELKEWIEVKQSIGKFAVKDLLWKIEQMKPTEREAFEKAFERGGEEFSNAYKQTIYHGSNYFKKTFTQS